METKILHEWKGRLDKFMEEKSTKAYEIYKNYILPRKSPSKKCLEDRR